MARSHFKHVVTDKAGHSVQNAAVYVFGQGTAANPPPNPPTGTAISGSMYPSVTGGSAISNPLISNDQGEVEAFLDTAQYLDVVVTSNSDGAYYPGNPSGTFPFASFIETGEAIDPTASGGGGGGAPVGAEYVVTAGHVDLTAEKVLGADVIMSGTEGSRPAASIAGRLWFSTDTAKLYRDTGAAWTFISGTELADLTEKAHGSLTGVGANDHHPQAHAIDGADHTGDIETAQIANDAVTYAKIQNISATDRLLGRDTAGAGDVEEITPAAARTMLDVPTTGEAILDAIVDAAGDLIIASAADTPARLARGSDGQVLASTASTVAWSSPTFSRGGTVLDPAGARDIMVWRALFACTVTNVRGHRKGGTGATINARKNQTSDHLASNLSLESADAWADGGAVQNTAYAAGDDLEIRLVSIAGAVTEVAIQIDMTRP